MWLGLGANLGDRAGALRRAVAELDGRGARVEAVSGLYATAPHGVADQPEFLNAACRVRTALDPPALLALAKAIEVAAGRAPGPRWGPRPLDIDILVWDGGGWHAPDLVIPHAHLADRRFALVPLVEIAPDLVLPDGTLISDLLAALAGSGPPVSRIGDLEPLR